MPIYEYQCSACGECFDELVRGAKPVEVRCAQCGSERVERVLSAFAVSASASRKTQSGAGPRPATRDGGPCGPACGCFPR